MSGAYPPLSKRVTNVVMLSLTGICAVHDGLRLIFHPRIPGLLRGKIAQLKLLYPASGAGGANGRGDGECHRWNGKAPGTCDPDRHTYRWAWRRVSCRIWDRLVLIPLSAIPRTC